MYLIDHFYKFIICCSEENHVSQLFPIKICPYFLHSTMIKKGTAYTRHLVWKGRQWCSKASPYALETFPHHKNNNNVHVANWCLLKGYSRKNDMFPFIKLNNTAYTENVVPFSLVLLKIIWNKCASTHFSDCGKIFNTEQCRRSAYALPWVLWLGLSGY